MADVVYQLDAVGGSKVEQESKKAESAMNRVQRGSAKGGLAVLELSRGLEDLSMAGMKGVMNNIPGLLMHLGIGAGLTGVVSMATVAVWKGVDALDAYLTKMRELQLSKFESLGITSIDPESIGKAFNPEAVKRAEKMKGVMEGMANAMGMVESVAQNNESIRKEESALKNAETMLQLTKDNVSEETKRFQTLVNSYHTEDEMLKTAKEKLRVQEEYMTMLKASRQGQMEEIGKINVDEIERINKIIRDLEIQFNKELIARGVSPLQAGTRAKQRAETAARLRIEDAFGSVKAYEEAARNREIARENLKIIDDQINKAQMLLDKEKQSVKAQEQITDLRKKRLTIENEIASVEENRKAKEIERKAMMDERVTDTSPFLTTQGRAGLSGNETQNALGLIGIARQQLSELRKIQRNTAKFTNSYA